jgi:phosphoribosylanthranilate isomerase
VRLSAEQVSAIPEHLHDPNADAVLVDSCSKTGAGGTGIAFNWDLAATTLFRNAGASKRIAAGGLNPANVAEAMAKLRPWGVDVASGVESAPGRKNPAKLRAFIANARAADNQ